ncbi:DUF3850 domain-containing protein [candidate division WWE3 bacterium]|uniref:DUF3850 domain-containing protein n=1 Tax=candidate division WWE3 bacterium TaxID=2053526 RepID=A0A7X9DJQ7_UNCKA|nr:DUF3850 domain-containing protein [candidate division WWE3 bacterium]
MKTIEKKIWSEYFDAVANGNKNFELRLADWEIDIGDVLILKDWNPKTKEYTGRQLERTVTYLIKTKAAEAWGMWPKEDIDKYGFQIIGIKPVETKKKILIFTEGTILMPASGKNLSREERVKQVINNEKSAHDFKGYIPIGNSVQILNEWVKNSCEIYYLTSRTTIDEITDIQNVLIYNRFPSGTLLFRHNGENYSNVAEKLIPDILIEDDCESIGGEIEMTYPNLSPEIKAKIKHYSIKEFGGIDHLVSLI